MQWASLNNAEILELDAMEEPPSVLEVEVFDFDGPFVKADSLGRAEINLIKHTSTELADMWVPLEGKLAQSSQSKLHLRIFLENNKGVETIKEYLTKKEKEVGKKVPVLAFIVFKTNSIERLKIWSLFWFLLKKFSELVLKHYLFPSFSTLFVMLEDVSSFYKFGCAITYLHSHMNWFDAVHLAVEPTISSQKFNVPKTISVAARGISH